MSNALAKAVTLASSFEGLRLTPYQDSGGVWTIGRGSTRDASGNPITSSTPAITEAQADALMARDMTAEYNAVQKMTSGFALNDSQIAALTDFAYNVGSGALQRSTLMRFLSHGETFGAAQQFLVWDRAGGEPLYGLWRRRVAEANAFCNS